MAFGADFGSGFFSKISTGITGANNVSARGGYKRGPHPVRVSAMKYVSAGFNFIVTLNEFTFGFRNVSGISVSRKVNPIAEGGVNDHGIIVTEPNQDSYTLNFSRGLMIRYPDVIDATALSAAAMIPNPIARKTALLAVNSASPQAALEKGPALGFIHVYDRNNKRLLGLYSFLSLGMTEWRVSDLDAESGASLLIEDMTIVHTGITREPTVAQPFAIAGALNSESDVDRQAREAYEKIEKAKEEAGYYDETPEEKIERINGEIQAVKDKIKKMQELVEQEEEPTDADLEGFSEAEKRYIKQARLSKKTRKTAEEIQQEKDKVKEEIAKNKENAEKAREAVEEQKEETETSKKETKKAADKKAEKMKNLIAQEEEPTEDDLKEFNEGEKHYIRNAWASKKTKKTAEEIQQEKDKVKEEIAKNKENAEKTREAVEKQIEETEKSKEEVKEAADKKAEKMKNLIAQEEEPTEDDLKEFNEGEKHYIRNAWASKKTRKTAEEIQQEKDKVKEEIAKHQEQVKERRAKSEESRAKAIELNDAKDAENKEHAQKVLEEREDASKK